MVGVEFTINGKPFTEEKFGDELDKAMFEAVVDGMKERIAKASPAADARSVRVNMVGNDLDSLSFEVWAADEDVASRVRAALST